MRRKFGGVVILCAFYSTAETREFGAERNAEKISAALGVNSLRLGGKKSSKLFSTTTLGHYWKFRKYSPFTRAARHKRISQLNLNFPERAFWKSPGASSMQKQKNNGLIFGQAVITL